MLMNRNVHVISYYLLHVCFIIVRNYFGCLGWFEDGTTSLGMKILKLTELLASLVLYSAYCASLVSLFSVPIVPVGSFKDILSYSFTLYAENYSLAARALLEVSVNVKPDKHLRELHEYQ